MLAWTAAQASAVVPGRNNYDIVLETVRGVNPLLIHGALHCNDEV
jgi:hypothetical protein